MPRTAALLCVHNEANRLGWWIAHHMAAGFSALLICDDHSTDGTQDILTQAARNYDIRLLTTDRQETDSLHRHQDALLTMLQQEGDHFDWIIQLAVDEYFTPDGGSVKAFLTGMEAELGAETFQKTSHLPVNWCLTGLGQWAHKTLDGQMPHPRALFQTHADSNFPDSRVTRSFFRPSSRQGLPDPFAHIHAAPDWSAARILHDAATSSHTPQMRRHFDRSEQFYDKGQALLPQTLDISAHLLQGLILGACYAIQNGQAPTSSTGAPPPETACRFNRFHLHRDRQRLALNRDSRMTGFHPLEELRDSPTLIPLCLIKPESPVPGMENRAWLYADRPSGLPYLPAAAPASTCFPTLLDCLPLHLQQDDGAVRLSLRPTALAFPDDAPVTLVPAEISSFARLDPVENALQHFTLHGFSAAGLHEAIRQGRWLSPSVIGALYAQLPEQEARTLFTPLLYRLFHDWPR